jgi:hypothetical protein
VLRNEKGAPRGAPFLTINVTWTGLNRFDSDPQLDSYTGARHDGYAQDAMFARR